MTNILRDLKEDAADDRIYLPREDLARFDYTADDLRAGVRDERFRQLMRFEIERTERLYAEAAELERWLAPDGQRVFGSMMAVYRALLEEIKRLDGDVLATRVSVSKLAQNADRHALAVVSLAARPRPARRRHEPGALGPASMIVGGGLAGLAAAVALAELDCQVELFEARRALGGRAASFRDPATGELVDHCQHVSMGCCTNLADFCRRTGTARMLSPRPRPARHRSRRARARHVAPAAWLPAPLHLVRGFCELEVSYARRSDSDWPRRLAVDARRPGEVRQLPRRWGNGSPASDSRARRSKAFGA